MMKKSFEQSMDRLNEIIRALDDEHAPLANSIELYGEAVKTIKELQGELDTAAGKVAIMRKNLDGFFTEDSFDNEF